MSLLNELNSQVNRLGFVDVKLLTVSILRWTGSGQAGARTTGLSAERVVVRVACRCVRSPSVRSTPGSATAGERHLKG